MILSEIVILFTNSKHYFIINLSDMHVYSINIRHAIFVISAKLENGKLAILMKWESHSYCTNQVWNHILYMEFAQHNHCHI